MATKRIIQLPTLNNGQVTGGNSSQGGFLRKLPNELPGGDGPNPKNVIQTPQTDANGNITGGGGKKTAMNSPEEPEVWTYRGNNGVVQTINKNTTPTNGGFTQYSSKTDRSAAVMNANKNGTTSSLPQATPANLPGVTKYAGIDKTAEGISYGNNQAGIDLVNKQNELDTLSKAEKAQRLAGAYNPTPTVATAQNPVIKKTLDKPQEQTVTPAALQGADINTLNSTLDELNYKVNVEGKQLSKDEYLAYASAKRQLQEMMKPQALTGGLDSLITNKENEIKQVTDESKINNDKELADFTRSQEVYKQAEIDAINQADEEQKKTLGFILGGQGAGQGTFAVEQIGKITQNTLAKKQALNEAVQAKIDLYGSQLRKDSQQTIQAMKDRLDSYYMKAAEFDVDNIKQMNEYNQKEGASKIEQIDKMMALSQAQAKAMQPLTEQEKAQAQAFAGNLYDNEGNFQNNVFEMLYKVNPKLANAAVLQGTAIQKERISNDMAMRGLDADIKRAQLNKLLNPAKEYEFVKDADGNTVAIDKENPSVQIKIGGGMTGGLGDMRYLANQFPGQARAKNNNPAGITWNANFDNPKPGTTAYALQQAGVSFEKGTPRPGNEGGNYVTFPTMEDGLVAQRIMMTQTYGNTTVGNMLAKWVGTGEGPRYAQQVAGMAGVDVNTIVNQLSDQQLQTLQMAKIQKESPGLAKILQQQTQGQDSNLTMQAQALVSGIGGTKEERADLVNSIVKIAQSEGISVQEAKAKLGLRSKTDDDVIDVRKKDWDKIEEGGKALTQVKGAIQALNNPNPTTDLIGIVGLLKSIDPTSVARSDEVQNVKKAAGVLEAAETQLKNRKSGDLLSSNQRKQLQEAMQTMVDTYERGAQEKRNQIIKDFDKRGIDPNIIFGTNEIEGSRSGIANELALQAGGANKSTQQTTGTLSGGTNRLKK